MTKRELDLKVLPPGGGSKTGGFTYIEVLIGAFLMLLFFSAIFSAYQLTLRVIGSSRARINATMIINQKIEAIRNLPYNEIGVVGGYPEGSLLSQEHLYRNNNNYLIETRVDFINDPFDGIIGDVCPNDYKRVSIRASWIGLIHGEAELSTDISPKGLSQECAEVGGTLSIVTLDASGNPVLGANATVTDIISDIGKTCSTDISGCYFVLKEAVEQYRVVVAKQGYSSERTYSKNEVATPLNPHPTIFEGQVTNISFNIDQVSSFNVQTMIPESENRFADAFLDQTKISQLDQTMIIENKAKLIKNINGEYMANGSVISNTVTPNPSTIISWKELQFTGFRPTNTDLFYQLFYFNGSSWVLIPDGDLSGNGQGFTESKDISALSVTKYPSVRIKGVLATTDPSTSPYIDDWTVSWKTSEPFVIGNVTFGLSGNKNIGKDVQGEFVYKYSSLHASNPIGTIDIDNLEWDTYTFSVDKTQTGLDLVSTQPSMPINLLPNSAVSVTLNVKAENSLTVNVVNVNTLAPIFGASVRLYNATLGYDSTKPTDINGNTLFLPLSNAVYTTEVQVSGFSPVTQTVTVYGQTVKTIKLSVQ
ncbi:MAG: carboxypeptidase-like regulatory domain-containing protein [bacterium]